MRTLRRFDALDWLGKWRVPIGVLLAIAVAWLMHGALLDLARLMALGFGNLMYAIITLPGLSGFSGFHYMTEQYVWPEVTSYFGVHVRIVAEAMAAAVAVAIPVGILLQRTRWLYVPVFAILDAIYTIPSIALFSLLIPVTGLTDGTVVIPLVAYAQFILVRNVIVGLDGVPAEVKEAARGMGMNPLQILLRIELPLALPVIVTGVRIATVASIGMTALAALVAIRDLGQIFVDTTTNGGANAYAEIYAGAVAVVVLALGVDLFMRVVERFVPANRVARAGKPTGLQRVVGRLLAGRGEAGMS